MHLAMLGTLKTFKKNYQHACGTANRGGHGRSKLVHSFIFFLVFELRDFGNEKKIVPPIFRGWEFFYKQ
jgi:hypothetical protein